MPLNFVPKGESGLQFEVWAGTFAIGRITRVVQGNAQEWRWFLTISAAPAGFTREGVSPSLEAAKEAAERSWQTWVRAARLSDLPSLPLEELKNAAELS